MCAPLWHGEVAVHADPLHHASFADLIFADDWNVVFALAGDDAGRATNALAQIDGHAPLVLLLVVEAVRVFFGFHPDLTLVERDVFRDVAVHAGLLGEGHILVERVDRAFTVNRAAFHGVLALRERQFSNGGEHFDLGTAQDERTGLRAQNVSVHTAITTDHADADLTVAQRQGDGVGHMAGSFDGGDFDRNIADGNLDVLTFFEAETAEGDGANPSCIFPSEFRHWIGSFLQPGVVDVATVIDAGVGNKDDFKCLVRRSDDRGGLGEDASNGSDIRSRSGLGVSGAFEEAVTQGEIPFLFVEAASHGGESIAHGGVGGVFGRGSRCGTGGGWSRSFDRAKLFAAKQREQNFHTACTVIERSDHRLDDRVSAISSTDITPNFKVVGSWNVQRGLA